MPEPVLRLYLLGRLDKERKSRTLIIFGEYKSLRGLSRVALTNDSLNTLLASIASLRGYVEGGFPPIDRNTLAKLGEQLFDVLITERTKELFLLATGEVRGRRQFLPLEIVAEDFEIAGWPWEYMYNSASQGFISQDFHPVSRSIFSMTSRSPLRQKRGDVNVLIILGVPPDDKYTTPTEEIKVIEDVFKTYLGREFEIHVLPAADYQKLQNGISHHEIDIVHYFGHAQFDYQRREGFLSIARPESEPFRLYAGDFANLLVNSHVRLVFLNACKTAQASPADNPARSSIAASLLDRGIPAVIGTQFSLPDVSAHSLASTIYNGLLTGRPIGEAVRVGRNAMLFQDKYQFYDWGIPVLYSTNPAQVLFTPRGEQLGWAKAYTSASAEGGQSLIEMLADVSTPGAPSIVVESTRPADTKLGVKVALIDIDAKIGFLPEMANLVNRSQNYFHFEVAYIPVPSGYVRTDLNEHSQTFVPRLKDVLLGLPENLKVDFICGLTQHMVAGESDGQTFWNHFAALVSDNVSVISTYDLRRYSLEAGEPFTRAVFGLCLSMLVFSDRRWKIEFHKETAGCLFDFCDNRDDIICGLKKKSFDHKKCRDKIKAPALLAAIDAFYTLDFSTHDRGHTDAAGQ